ncbi:hypothetical protein JM93_00866 [Roseibium hamelinense]|uniref:DUF3299 domain-containing protein n=1 Tax=Roseibium hamelinense TaxID=150831 RepID=A0A562TK70_9HYPH|nr:DUF3299 domain-containing protein [Roseibium hamelinense]TWI93310.1 hypothetical protein JM93_00866 [Roseibium hamelinense]
MQFRGLIVFLVAVTMGTQVFAKPPVAIGWADLKDPHAEFNDPFEALGIFELQSLSTYLRAGQQLQDLDLDDATRKRLENRRRIAANSLKNKGYDAQRLVDQRFVVAEKRARAGVAGNPDLDGKPVKLSGFVIPAPPGASGKPRAYLVPELGMCAHVPPPPANNLVLAHLPGSTPVLPLFTQITVTGTLTKQLQEQTMRVVDGPVRMISLWTLDATGLEIPQAN